MKNGNEIWGVHDRNRKSRKKNIQKYKKLFFNELNTINLPYTMVNTLQIKIL